MRNDHMRARVCVCMCIYVIIQLTVDCDTQNIADKPSV